VRPRVREEIILLLLINIIRLIHDLRQRYEYITNRTYILILFVNAPCAASVRFYTVTWEKCTPTITIKDRETDKNKDEEEETQTDRQTDRQIQRKRKTYLKKAVEERLLQVLDIALSDIDISASEVLPTEDSDKEDETGNYPRDSHHHHHLTWETVQ